MTYLIGTVLIINILFFLPLGWSSLYDMEKGNKEAETTTYVCTFFIAANALAFVFLLMVSYHV